MLLHVTHAYAKEYSVTPQCPVNFTLHLPHNEAEVISSPHIFTKLESNTLWCPSTLTFLMMYPILSTLNGFHILINYLIWLWKPCPQNMHKSSTAVPSDIHTRPHTARHGVDCGSHRSYMTKITTYDTDHLVYTYIYIYIYMIRNSLTYRDLQRLYCHLLVFYNTKTPLTRQRALHQTFLLTPDRNVAVGPSVQQPTTNFTYVIRSTNAYV